MTEGIDPQENGAPEAINIPPAAIQ